jgi:anti-anti-sigma regulatory factor
MVDQPVVKISTSKINSDASGFSNVARIHRDLANLSRTKVTLDFGRLAWIDGHLAASLHVIFLHANARSVSFQFEGLSPTVAATIKKKLFLIPKQIDTYNTSIP